MMEDILTQIRAKLTTSRAAGSILAEASQPAKLKSSGSHLNQPLPLVPCDSFLSPQHLESLCQLLPARPLTR